MVVARKTPVAPPPPASRSTSTQPLPRAAKTKTALSSALASGGPAIVSSAPNGVVKTPKKSKAGKKHKPKHSSSLFSNHLFLLLLSVLSIYSYNVCPTDHPRTSSVCSGLDLYRAHILDPYIVPPIQTLYTHASPHLEPYIAPLAPYAHQALDFTQIHITPPIKAASAFAVAQYKQHVAPRVYFVFVTQYWNGIVKPIYYKGLHPHVEHHSRPYRIYYRRFLVPLFYRSLAHTHAFYISLKPHLHHWGKIFSKASTDAYRAVQPVAQRAFVRTRPYVLFVLGKVQEQLLVVSGIAADARREFVDPHVRRIWDKVGEFSATQVQQTTRTTTEVTEEPTPTQASEEEPTHTSSSAVPEPTPEPTLVEEEVTVPVVHAEPEPEVTASTPEETPSPSPTPTLSQEEEAEATDDITIEHASPIPTTEYAADSAASVVAASLHVSATPEEPVSTSDPTSAPAGQEDVDDFLKDLGFDGTEPTTDSPSADSTPPPPEVEEPTEIPLTTEEQLLLTAAKRKDLTERHVKWQAELTALAANHLSTLSTTLTSLRLSALSELSKWGKDGKGVGAEVEGEAHRLVKGAEGYLRGIEARVGEARVGKEEVERERGRWARVLEKVEEKFAERVVTIQGDVHAWFVSLREREVAEVDNVSSEVKAFADQAQGNLGLDYAWLDDVTYYDWQKYHDLARTSENFTLAARTLQAVIDPKGTNVLVDGLNDLEGEVNELGEGFAVLLGDVRRRGEEMFDRWVEVTKVEEEKEKEKEKGSVPVVDNTEGEGEKVEEPVVSILPVPEDGEDGLRTEEILIGKSREQVEANLQEVPLEDVRAGREEL